MLQFPKASAWNESVISAVLDQAFMQPSSGYDVYPRPLLTSGQRSMTSGVLYCLVFTPYKTITVSNILTSCITAAVDTNAAASVRRLAVFSVGANGQDMTTLARTANDTTIWASANTNYTKPLDSTITLNAGSTYAVGALYVLGGTLTTQPILNGVSAMGNPINTLSPGLAASFPSLTDMPTGTTTTTFGIGSGPWARLT